MWIACEGLDGSGKTTVSVRVAQRLRERGLKVFHVREKGGFRSRLASRIRDLTRNAELTSFSPEAELLLNAARETQVITEEIRPALARGEIVITDRGLYSHMIVARSVRALPRLEVNEISEFAAGGLWPNLAIYFDVDPDVARYRKRLRKIREKRLGSSSRKGLLGSMLTRLSRAAFFSLATGDPCRWRILDNSWRTADEAEAQVLSLIAPILGLPAPAKPSSPSPLRVEVAGSMDSWMDHFFAFAEEVFRRDPAQAALWVSGIDDPRAEAIRAAAIETDPDVVTWTISGRDTPEAWSIRKRTVDHAPYHVARSLVGLDDETSWRWRERLAGSVPDQVLHSLGGLGRPDAHAMRERLWEASPDDGLRSLSGLEDPMAWSFRCRSILRGGTAALAESLGRLGTRTAWELRQRLIEDFPLSVLRSVKGLDDDRAWAIRDSLEDKAPRPVVDTVQGLQGERARRLRKDLEADLPEEVASSLAGIDDPAAWEDRRRLLKKAPIGVLESLRGLESDRRTADLVEQALAQSDGRPRIVRKAVSLHLAAASRVAGSVPRA